MATEIQKLAAMLKELGCEYPTHSQKSTPPLTPKKRDRPMDTPPAKTASVEIQKLAGLLNMAGRGLGVASKALGALPTGVGNVAAGAMGALGGAMSAPAGHRFAGAAAGSLNGLPGGMGLVAPMIAGHAMGV